MTPPLVDAAPQRSARIAAIDWMRGVVMILMVLDHASMAFNGAHFSADAAAIRVAPGQLEPFAFLSRWMTHLCAPTFVFLAGTALALSIEKRLAKGADPKQIDRDILIRGAIILALDPTIVSLGTGRLTFQVLYAIGLAMMAMAFLRRLPTWGLLAVSLGWLAFGEAITELHWDPDSGPSQAWEALIDGRYSEAALKITYPVLPWLAMMVLGWTYGRSMVSRLAAGDVVSPRRMAFGWGLGFIALFVVVRALNGYGNLDLVREGGGWLEWLYVSKYPPSLSFAALELGLLGVLLATLMALERLIGVRSNGLLLVYGQTSMFFYLAHRLLFEGSATWLGLRGTGDLVTAYIVALVSLALLYPGCRWYRGFKKAHPKSLLRFF